MAKGDSKEVAQQVDFDGNAVAPIPEAVRNMIAELKTWTAENSDSRNAGEISLDIVDRILSADTLEEAMQGTADLADLLGQPLTVDVKSWLRSTLGEFGVFAVIEATDDAGKTHVISNGGRNIVAIFYRLAKEERLPCRGKFRAVRTNQGYDTYWFDLLPA